MAIEKLLEFAKDGQKNTDDLNLTDGFPVSKKPARQWFNWLFNSLTSKVNEIIDAEFIPKAEIVDNLTTNDATKPLSANAGKSLQDGKLGKSENAVSATDCSRQVIAGNGLSGGGILTANRTLTLGTPTKITSSSTNSVTTTSHTHEIDNASTSVAGVVQLNNTLTSTSTSEAATANTVKLLNDRFINDFLNLKTKSGYQKLPSGLIIQWGVFTPNQTTAIGSPQYINFPIAFPNNLLFAIPSTNGAATGGSEMAWVDTSLSTTSKLGIYSNYNNSVCWYFAIGY